MDAGGGAAGWLSVDDGVTLSLLVAD